jgi:MYXO-CTERM domain-containing protein
MQAHRLVLLVCLIIPSLVHAETWTKLDDPTSGDPGSAVLSFLQSHAETFGAGSHLSLQVARTTPVNGGVVVRVAARHAKLPVLNQGLSVMILHKRLVAVSGSLRSSPASSTFGLSRAQAEARVRDRMPGASIRSAVQGYWASGGTLRPAWQLQVERTRPFGLFRVAIDGQTGAVLDVSSRLVEVFGNAYTPGNPSVGQVSQVELQGLTKPGELTGDYASVSSCSYSEQSGLSCKQLATPDSTTGDFLYKPIEPSFKDPFSEVHAYFHVDAFHRFLKDTFGFKRKTDSQQIKVMVNFAWESSNGSTQGMYNAFFGDMNDDGKGDLVFGQGKKDFAYDADVIYHEFTHSAVDETSNLSVNLDELGLNMMPMGLNEAFADTFSCIYAGDPKVGEYAGGSNGIRQLVGAASCPGHLTGESHQDGLLWGRACWTVREQVPEKDRSTFDDVLWKTMVGVDQYAGFADAAALFLKIAQVEAPAIEALAKAEFTSRSLDTCSRIVPLTEADTYRGYLMGLSSLPVLQVVPGPLQYKIEAPENASELTINIGPVHGQWGGTTIGAYVRKGSPVSFASSKPVFDFVMPNNETSIVLSTKDVEKRLEAGNVYYVIPLNVGANSTMYQITMGLTLEDPPPTPDATPSLEPDAGPGSMLDSTPPTQKDPDPDDPAAGGCSCEVTPSPAAPLGILGLLALALLLVRRRRD